MPNEPESKLDHFKIWLVKEKEFSRDVTLEGQFDEEVKKQKHLEKVVWIANPVKKKSFAPRRESAHLVGYYLTPPKNPGPQRWVILSNQFHKEQDRTKWTLGDPELLLLPASKVEKGDPPPPPTDLDHFECYVVKNATSIDEAFKLEDQFDKKLKKIEEIKKIEPAFFCVPVSKNGGKRVNPHVHLALYDITPRVDINDAPISVIARDQFGKLELKVLESLMLAVPSQKLDSGPRKKEK